MLETLSLVLGINNFDYEYCYDSEVIECELDLYMLLLTQDKTKEDEMFVRFEGSYKKLSKEKQYYVNEKLKRLLKKQDENNKEKEKKL